MNKPFMTYKEEAESLRDKLAEAQAREAELMAHVERLRETMNDLLMLPDKYPGHRDIMTMEIIAKVLAATPAQSLARLRNEVLEEAAKLAEKQDSYILADEIRAMKEPEQ